MVESEIESEFLSALLKCKPGDRLPSLTDLSEGTGISVGKLREQMEVARTLGLVEASPRRGITRTDYSFLPAVRLSLLVALAIDRQHFDAISSLRTHLEVAYWDEAVVLLTSDDIEYLQTLVRAAWDQLNQTRVRIPYEEHRELHIAIFRRLNNPFVQGLLEAYWDAYEAVELNAYADYAYLQQVWQYHDAIVDAICRGRYAHGKQLLIEHMRLLDSRGVSSETRVDPAALAL